RDEARSIRRRASRRFDEKVYIVFEPPYYKVRVGNFDNWGEAGKTQKIAKENGFTDAWIVGAKAKRNGSAPTQSRKPRRTFSDSRGLNGGKFGFFDIEYPAVGIGFPISRVSPHLQLHFDGDLVLANDPILLLDFSLRYLFDSRSQVLPYVGGGPGAVLGDRQDFTAHFVGGLDFRIDRVPAFAELKIHLNRPDAVSLWFGLRF
ncbi:hypothetical protein MJD09_26480, partial [bacterium]|nr:hypothetical protein [bacterium]